MNRDARPKSPAGQEDPEKQRLILRGLNGNFEGMLWEAESAIRAGRWGELEVVLNDSSVSRQHFEIRPTADGWILRDLGSSNGTYVNGQRVAPSEDRMLQSSDIIRCGTVKLAVEFPLARKVADLSVVPKSTPASLPLQVRLEIEKACTAFENAWKEGKYPRVEEFVEAVSLEGKSKLLRELLSLERSLLRHIGEEQQWEQQLKRFPAEGKIVKAAAVKSIPGYDIIEEVGRGGMGIVYKALHKDTNRLVALKMILASEEADESTLARFRNEAKAAASLHHPNIVQLYDFGERHGQPFIALEFIDGEPLQRRGPGEPLPIDEAARIAETLARALHHAHQRGVIHRDLKPSNILMTREGAPKITDFGLAKFLLLNEFIFCPNMSHAVSGPVGGLTKKGEILGTPAFMSPEQAAGAVDAAGPGIDIHALGATLYQMLTGQSPFPGQTAMQVLMRIRTERPLPVRHHRRDVPEELEVICLKCLEKPLWRRYGTALMLADDLAHFIETRSGTDRRKEPAQAEQELDADIADLTRCIMLDPHNLAGAYASRGELLIRKGLIDKALADLSQAIRIDPEYAWAYAQRGIAHLQKREYDKAIEDCAKAVLLNPIFPWPAIVRKLSS